jgi:penicillin-binding protein 1A
VAKSKRSNKALSVYTNLNNQRKAKKEVRQRRKAEYLATLPKHPVKRVMYRLHPKRFWSYWFSREGGIMALKIAGVGTLLVFLLVAGLFAYYRQEIAAIRPTELASRVQTTVTRYTDRNGVLLWEDKGFGDYKLVVKSEDISDKMKQATIAIEDKDFYKHGGFSATGIMRATWNNLTGGDTQGASTLTQQLVKQVFFRDEAADRSFGGVPRKIKETILAIEVERSYNKDQILTMYLNESSYGGRRNGVQSAARTYFEKDAKDLTLAEASMLASIPQQPGRFDPYNVLVDPDAKKDLLARQATTLSYMVEQGFITKKEAEEAKKVPVLDNIKPEADQFRDIKAPHFVQMVKAQLEGELGQATVGAGGLTVKTTLDWRVQEIVDQAIVDLFNSSAPRSANFDNGAATVVDTQTGQVLAMRGSRDYNYPGFGSNNYATAFIQPGSSIKPFVFAALFKQKPDVNYGAGSIVADTPIPQSIYRTADGTSLANFDNKFRGSIPIRSGLAESRNVPAVKAMYITGRDATLNTIHDMGDKAYCTDGPDKDVGLSAAIGGCGLRQVEHANAFATIGRMGVYKPVASVLEVKNAEGQTIKKWKDESKQAVDPQIAYMLADILSDDTARAPSFGRGASGLNVPGVKTFTKTGTSNIGRYSSNLWMNSVSPKMVLSLYVGNHEFNKPMGDALSYRIGPTVGKIVESAHKNVFQTDGTWKPGDWYTQPAGLQRLTVAGRSDLFPSWYNKNQANPTEKMSFDKISKKKATDCTPESAKEILDVQKFTDPITKKPAYIAPAGYDTTANDDLHKCDDVKPFVTLINYGSKKITASVSKGTHALQTVEFVVDGQSIGSVAASESGDYTINYDGKNKVDITVNVTDTALYTGSASRSFN